MNGIQKNFLPQFVHHFPGFEKEDEESQEVFSNLVTLSEKLELDWQEDFIKLLPVKHEKLTNEDLMEMETQRKDKESKQEEGTEEPKRFTTQEVERAFSLFEETLLIYKVQEPNIKKYIKIAAPVQNAVQHYRIICDGKKNKNKK